MKEGYKTTEFWITLASQLLSVLVLLGLVSATDSTTLNGAVAQVITSVFVVIGNLSVIITYIKARTYLKLPQQPETRDNVPMA